MNIPRNGEEGCVEGDGSIEKRIKIKEEVEKD